MSARSARTRSPPMPPGSMSIRTRAIWRSRSAGSWPGSPAAISVVADLKIFTIGMTVGQGFIALAITMLGRWNPYRIVAGANLFGMLRSLGRRAANSRRGRRTEFISMLPYIGIMLGLVFLAGRTALPAALGIPYARGQR